MAAARDRRGRGRRGPLAWPPVPAMVSRRTDFDDIVRECAARASRYLGPRHGNVEFAVEDVPPTDPAPWEEQSPALGRTLGDSRRGQRIVVYRRPIEVRTGSRLEVEELVQEVVAEQVAALLGVPPEEIDL